MAGRVHFLVAATARALYAECWGAGFTAELCCGKEEACFGDPFAIFNRAECCGSGRALTNPLAGLAPPEHPPVPGVQEEWEARVALASTTADAVDCEVGNRTVTLRRSRRA